MECIARWVRDRPPDNSLPDNGVAPGNREQANLRKSAVQGLKLVASYLRVSFAPPANRERERERRGERPLLSLGGRLRVRCFVHTASKEVRETSQKENTCRAICVCV